MILSDLLKLAERDDLLPQEAAALSLAITMLGGQPAPLQMAEYALLPHKIELLNGRLVLS